MDGRLALNFPSGRRYGGGGVRSRITRSICPHNTAHMVSEYTARPEIYDGHLMTTGNTQTFAERFARLTPLIRDEWPQVDGEALEQTQGDFDRVVALIATETDHSKTLVKKQLEEISTIANDNGASQNEVRKLRQMVDRLQAKSQDVTDYVKKQMVTDAREKVGQNPIAALLMAMGLGVLLGFILRGVGRGRS